MTITAEEFFKIAQTLRRHKRAFEAQREKVAKNPVNPHGTSLRTLEDRRRAYFDYRDEVKKVCSDITQGRLVLT